MWSHITKIITVISNAKFCLNATDELLLWMNFVCHNTVDFNFHTPGLILK